MPARGGTWIDRCTLIATLEDALTVSLGRFTVNGGLHGSGAFTKIEWPPTRASSLSPAVLALRDTTVLAGCFGAGGGAAAEDAFLPGRLAPAAAPLATALTWLLASGVFRSPALPSARPLSADVVSPARGFDPGVSFGACCAAPAWSPLAPDPSCWLVSCESGAALDSWSTGAGGLTLGAACPWTHASTYAIHGSSVPRPTVAPKAKNSAATTINSKATRPEPVFCRPASTQTCSLPGSAANIEYSLNRKSWLGGAAATSALAAACGTTGTAAGGMWARASRVAETSPGWDS